MGYLFFQTLIYQKQNAPYRWEHLATVLLTLSTYITRCTNFGSSQAPVSGHVVSEKSCHHRVTIQQCPLLVTSPPSTLLRLSHKVFQEKLTETGILSYMYSLRSVKLPHVHTNLHTETHTSANKASVWSFISNWSSPASETASLTKSLSFSSMFIQRFAAIYPDPFPAACLLKFLLIIEHSV